MKISFFLFKPALVGDAFSVVALESVAADTMEDVGVVTNGGAPAPLLTGDSADCVDSIELLL